MTREHAPENAMDDPQEVAAFYDAVTPLMRTLLEQLAQLPPEPRPFGEVEDALGWPRRRISSVLGGAARLRVERFQGRRPYRFLDDRTSPSRRWELWADATQGAAIRAEAARRGA